MEEKKVKRRKKNRRWKGDHRDWESGSVVVERQEESQVEEVTHLKKRKDVNKEEEKEDAQDEQPWKDKPAEFFVMSELRNPPEQFDKDNPWNLELNDAQWAFIYQYYDEYSSSPYEIMSWIYEKALAHEQSMAENKTKQDSILEKKYNRCFVQSQKSCKKQPLENKVEQIQPKYRPKQKRGKEVILREKYVDLDPEGSVAHAKKHCTLAMIGPKHSGKSTICGQI